MKLRFWQYFGIWKRYERKRQEKMFFPKQPPKGLLELFWAAEFKRLSKALHRATVEANNRIILNPPK